jgi:hypothetical protein
MMPPRDNHPSRKIWRQLGCNAAPDDAIAAGNQNVASVLAPFVLR